MSSLLANIKSREIKQIKQNNMIDITLLVGCFKGHFQDEPALTCFPQFLILGLNGRFLQAEYPSRHQNNSDKSVNGTPSPCFIIIRLLTEVSLLHLCQLSNTSVHLILKVHLTKSDSQASPLTKNFDFVGITSWTGCDMKWR